MYASREGHKDIAIALAEKGADLNIQDTVSDCYLLVHDSEENAGHVELPTFCICVCIYVYVYPRTSIYFICLFVYMFIFLIE